MEEKDIFAFVLMPFSSAFDDIYKFGVKEPASELGIVAERVDEQIYREGILERIYRQIEYADIIIADMSGQNPNVFYEVGYAHAKEKLCVLLTSDSNDIPFDLKHRRHIVYGGSINLLKDRIIEELNWAKEEILNIRKSKIQVTLTNTFALLNKTKHYANADVEFKIDLQNDSEKTSSDIEAIYFYCKKAWTIYQDDKECPSTESDIPKFSRRHFLKPPVRKLHKKSWAQLKFNSKRTLAYAFKGEELKDSYPLTGRVILRLITSEGPLDYELYIDTTADELPF